MNCLAVRDRFSEYALGSLPLGDGDAVERHLAWCAACRKEVSELEGASAMLGFALAPVDAPEELEPRVVDAVKTAAARGPSRRARSGVAAVLAAVLAVAGLGWGAVMAGRAERNEARAREAQQQMEEALTKFRAIISNIPEPLAVDAHTRIGVLTAPAGRQGGGAAFTFLSRQVADFAFVMVRDLPQQDAPYRVALVSPDGDTVRVGRIEQLDTGGGAELLREFDVLDLRRYTGVVVRDSAGLVALTADVGPRSRLAGP